MAADTSSSPIRLAIQKGGRLTEDSLQLLRECGIEFPKGSQKLKCRAVNFPIEFLFLRDDDIPGYVADGVADIGIVGENVAAEQKKPIDILERLGFAECRLSLAVPRAFDYRQIGDLTGRKIATSFPNLLGDFLKAARVNAEIHQIRGSVEIAPSIGLADAICDLVSSGSTLISNGLKEVEVIFRSQAVLVSNQDLAAGKKRALENLRFRMGAVNEARRTKYIMLNAPLSAVEAICRIVPGMKSPSIVPLAKEGWCSMHSVVQEDAFWAVTEQLRALGAQGILVVPIEKMLV